MDRLNLRTNAPMFYTSDGKKIPLSDMSLEELADAKFELLDKMQKHKTKIDKIKQVIQDIDVEAEKRGYRIFEYRVPSQYKKV